MKIKLVVGRKTPETSQQLEFCLNFYHKSFDPFCCADLKSFNLSWLITWCDEVQGVSVSLLGLLTNFYTGRYNKKKKNY